MMVLLNSYIHLRVLCSNIHGNSLVQSLNQPEISGSDVAYQYLIIAILHVTGDRMVKALAFGLKGPEFKAQQVLVGKSLCDSYLQLC